MDNVHKQAFEPASEAAETELAEFGTDLSVGPEAGIAMAVEDSFHWRQATVRDSWDDSRTRGSTKDRPQKARKRTLKTGHQARSE